MNQYEITLFVVTAFWFGYFIGLMVGMTTEDQV